MGSGNSRPRPVVVSAADLPPKCSATEEEEHHPSVSHAIRIPDDVVPETNTRQETRDDVTEESHTETAPSNDSSHRNIPSDHSDDEVDANSPGDVTPTPSTQQDNSGNDNNGMGDLDLDRRSVSLSDGDPPNYEDLYPTGTYGRTEMGHYTVYNQNEQISAGGDQADDPVDEDRNSGHEQPPGDENQEEEPYDEFRQPQSDDGVVMDDRFDEQEEIEIENGSHGEEEFGQLQEYHSRQQEGYSELERPASTRSNQGQTPPNRSDEDGINIGLVQPLALANMEGADESSNITEDVQPKEVTHDKDSMRRSRHEGRRKAKLRKRKKIIDKEIQELSVIPEDYPPPRPSKTTKADITSPELYQEPDKRAQQVTPDTVETLDELYEQLIDGLLTDVQRVRAILMWMGYHTSLDLAFKPDKYSPLGYLKRLDSGSVTHSELFTLLCRKAGIPCVLVEGFAKTDDYTVGKESLNSLVNTWTAVYLAGGWRLVFPLWVLTNEADEKVTSGGEISDGDVNEFFFLTDPEEFIFRCYPVKPEWQLLQTPYSKEKFKRVPYISSRFFDSYIGFPESQDGTIQASNGHCKLNVTLREGREEDAKLATVMILDRNTSGVDLPADAQLNKYVAIIHCNRSRRMNVRLPCNGVYRLKLSDSKRGWLCSFLIVSEKSKSVKHPFPYHPVLDFGPGDSTLDAGLVPSSHISGVMHIQANQETQVLFDMTEDMSVETKLYNYKNEIKNCVTHDIQNFELKIKVKVPVDGEYSLIILTRSEQSNTEYNIACNYLLTSENIHTRTKVWENPVKRKARQRLVFVTQKSNNPEVLQQALNAFQNLDVQSKGEVVPALEKINFLKIKQELSDAIERRSRQMLQNSIAQAKSCQTHKAELLPIILEAETCLGSMTSPSSRRTVLSLGRQTVSEIARYMKPRPLVHDIMTATMILLGESPSDVEQWSNIQKYLKRSGRNGFLNKIRRFEISRVSVDEAEKAYRLIDRYDRDSAIDGGSAGAGTFYVWVTDVTERVLGMEDK
ncbi:hillarin-like isoform X2 [Argopecten irradians]|uniref:hillarin-like isoform X2 n=1 Tax=Argopecten irradians TaxID=31199 RepID=UPI00371EDAF1